MKLANIYKNSLSANHFIDNRNNNGDGIINEWHPIKTGRLEILLAVAVHGALLSEGQLHWTFKSQSIFRVCRSRTKTTL